MSKAALFVRVSTTQQDYERQIKELTIEANRNGYANDDIIIIKQKESAIKLSEEQRQGLNELKDVIENNDVKIVLCWEISRLARRSVVLYSIRDYLVEHKVQLCVMNPFLKLMDNNYKITESANMMFAIYGAMAESEMSVKKERMRSGKLNNIKNSKYAGGNYPFGYYIDERTKYLCIDEQKANIVKKIFNMYTEESKSIAAIARELRALGYLDADSSYDSSYMFVKNTLHRIAYTGVKPKSGYILEQIISKEQYEKAQQIMDGNRKNKNRRSQNIALCRNLIHIGGRTFTPEFFSKSYTCRYQLDRTSTKFQSMKLQAEMVDEIVWNITKKFYTFSDEKKQKIDLKNRLLEINRKIRVIEANKEKLEAQADKIQERIIKGKLSEEKGDAMLDGINEEYEKANNDIVKLKSLYDTTYRQLADVANHKTKVDDTITLEDKKLYIDKVIERIDVEKANYSTAILHVKLKNGDILNYEYVSCKGKHYYNLI